MPRLTDSYGNLLPDPKEEEKRKKEQAVALNPDWFPRSDYAVRYEPINQFANDDEDTDEDDQGTRGVNPPWFL